VRLASIQDALQQLCSAEGQLGQVAAAAAAGSRLPAAVEAAPAPAQLPPPALQLDADDDEDEEVRCCVLRHTPCKCCQSPVGASLRPPSAHARCACTPSPPQPAAAAAAAAAAALIWQHLTQVIRCLAGDCVRTWRRQSCGAT
jgi:hypothetical protein